ncbi:MAG: hypothetical protein R2794_06440 [Chitinophagales bacterium]
MKNILKVILLAICIGAVSYSADAQVVMKEFLSENHTGKIEKSFNNGGKPLYYKFEYVSTDDMRIYYKLYLYKDAAMKTPWESFNVLMRNLNWQYYVDITMPKDGADKVAALIFKKDLRWSRVKYTPHEGCSRLAIPEYERYTIGDRTGTPKELYDGLLQDFLTQLDKNVDFSCYAGAMAK